MDELKVVTSVELHVFWRYVKLSKNSDTYFFTTSIKNSSTGTDFENEGAAKSKAKTNCKIKKYPSFLCVLVLFTPIFFKISFRL